MNKKVAQTVIYLMWIFLIAFACIKLFFGEWFAIQIDNERLILLGNFIDTHEWLRQLLFFLSSYFTYFLYLCACLQTWNLGIKQHICIGILLLIMIPVRMYASSVGVYIDIMLMVLLPCIWGANYKQVSVIFVAHFTGQLLSLYCRSLPLLLASVDYATQFILCIDGYMWLITYYLYANKYKESLLWEVLCLRFMAIIRKMKSLRKSKDSKKTETELTVKSQNLKQNSKSDESTDKS